MSILTAQGIEKPDKIICNDGKCVSTFVTVHNMKIKKIRIIEFDCKNFCKKNQNANIVEPEKNKSLFIDNLVLEFKKVNAYLFKVSN